MKSVLRLDRTYDVGRLEADLQTALSVGTSYENRGDYHDGGWNAIALHSLNGETTPEALRWAGWKAPYEKTDILKACPYLEEIVDSFHCPKARIRLLQLEPGANIHTHRDDGDGWAVGKVRLHIPIVTHDEIYFYVDNQRVMMEPGTLWYCDFTKPHRVENRGTTGRIHMVMDMMVNDWMRTELFPPESLFERGQNFTQLAIYRARLLRHQGPSAVRKLLKNAKKRVRS